MRGSLRLDDETQAVTGPQLPKSQPGARRADGRRAVSGLPLMPRSG
ncbi:hypothetical protein [Marinimicrococcus flavescens]|uniref:Uncharacterized protein n=1 Tax=Marinimicrococcus flavescens TaxID=3031815 RepID=A0AAP3V101_9PROT|nr:hypothetical protein [Marinimicrococcus flavescens]